MSAAGASRGRVFLVVLGCLICQLGLGYGYVFGPLAPDILAEFDWTRTAYSAARAPQLFVIALASPLIGMTVVRAGSRAVLVAGAVSLALCYVLLSRMQDLWHLYALIGLQGLAVAGLGDISVGQVVTRWTTRNRGLALGVVYVGSNLGGAILTRAAAAIADRASWREAFLVMGIGALLVILPFAAFVVREPRGAELEIPKDPGSASSTANDIDLRGALRTRSFWILAAVLFSFFFYFLGMLEHLVLALVDGGMERGDAVAHFSNAIALGIASKIGYGWLADRMRAKTAILVDYGILALSSLVLLAVPNVLFLWAFVLTYGIATAARDVVYPLIITSCFGLGYMAEIYGAVMLALAPGGALGPIFAGFVHDRTGSYDLAFATFAVLNLLAVGALFLLRDERARYTAAHDG